MKTIKNSKEITTLEVGDRVMFGDLTYIVTQHPCCKWYYLLLNTDNNDEIFKILNLKKRDFVEHLGIDANTNVDFPEVKSLEALTAIVSALFKEYEKQNEFPKTWGEFCERNPIQQEEYFINDYSDIRIFYGDNERDFELDKNLCISEQEAEAFLALMQLRQLRKAYVKDWEPNDKQQYYGIVSNIHGLDIIPHALTSRSMSFPTRELANQFLLNFKDLLEIAKSLL